MDSKQKKALYESIMNNVAKQVKKALSEMKSSTYFNAADAQERKLHDDDYVLSHTAKQLVKNKKRIQAFKDWGQQRSEEEEFEKRQGEIRSRRSQEAKVEEFFKSECEPWLEKLKSLVTPEIIEKAVYEALTDGDWYDATNQFPCKGRWHKSFDCLLEYYTNADAVLEYIAESIGGYEVENGMILPEGFSCPDDIDDAYDWISDEESDMGLDRAEFNEVAKRLFLHDNKLVWDGSKYVYPMDLSVEDCKFKYFIDCSYDGEIDRWCDRESGSYGDDVLFIRNNNASEYSDYIGILCKYKRDANNIVEEIGEWTGREWEAPGVQEMRKGQPKTLWDIAED